MKTDETFRVAGMSPAGAESLGPAIDASVLELARQLALSTFPDGSTVEWSDDVDENGCPLKLLTIFSPGSSKATHEAYLAFIRAWVRAEPPDRRRPIRVSCRAAFCG